MNNKITISKFKNDIIDSNFRDIYRDLLDRSNKGNLSNIDMKKIFTVALILINYGDRVCEKLGYRIILMYANKYKDYIPLYDYAISKNYIPICKMIDRIMNIEVNNEGFNSMFLSAYLENFKDKHLYLSQGQKEIINFTKKVEENYVVIAPTSYGKSEIMIRLIEKNINKKVCILVPTKALIAQTKKRIINEFKNVYKCSKIIVHPDMYNGEESFIAVLTQERLLRLLKKNENLFLDTILVDEAHNLLEEGERATLLAYTLIISKKRNELIDIKYFTPFLAQAKNIDIPYLKKKIESIKVDEQLKIERFYYIENSNSDIKIDMYDQFFDEFYNVKTLSKLSDVKIIAYMAKNKNIIYLNKSIDLERVAEELAKENKLIEENKDIQDMCNSIEDFLHKDYKVIKCLRCGVVYHHGSVPDLVRLYIEDIYKRNSSIKFMVTSSTLLEGVNIPAENLFILQNKKGRNKLTPSQFRNLIGRVGRFSEIFSEEKDDLELLEPEIYILKGEYCSKKYNIRKFIKECAKENREIKDQKNNFLLKSDKEIEVMSEEEVDKLEGIIEELENIEPNSITNEKVIYASHDIGKICFANNIKEMNIIKNEESLYCNLKAIESNKKITSCEELFKVIHDIFLRDNLIYNKNQENFLRLREEKARKFYSMFLEWKCNTVSYKEMISRFLWYWKNLKNPIVYVGIKWGEIKRNENDFYPLYININDKTDYELVNLAIVRIKEESEFVDNIIIKFVEVINDLGLIDKTFYEKVKYGTNDPEIICLLKNGYSIELSKCILSDKLKRYVHIDLKEDKIKIDSKIIIEMEKMNINKILVFEVKYQANL